jgi:hypothetical protein
MRLADGFQATASIDRVQLHDHTLAAELRLQVSFPRPAQDEHLPHRIEAQVHAAGLEAQRCRFRALMEKADHEVVLEIRDGDQGQGIQRRGTRPDSFVTDFGTVTIERIRVSHRADGHAAIPSHTAWDTPKPVCLTRGRRDASCDEMLARSAGRSQADLSDRADQEDLIARSTVLNVVHQEGAELLAAQHQRAVAALEEHPEARAVLLPRPPADADTADADTAGAEPLGPAEESVPWSQIIPVGFTGAAAAAAVATDEPRAVDPGRVRVELDAVKTQAQPSTGRKQVLTFTGVVLVGGRQYLLADGTTEGRFEQLAGLLCRLDVRDGTRPLLVLADGASWIRTWFEDLGLAGKTMIVCWYHVTKRCDEDLSGAGFAKESPCRCCGTLNPDKWMGSGIFAITGSLRSKEHTYDRRHRIYRAAARGTRPASAGAVVGGETGGGDRVAAWLSRRGAEARLDRRPDRLPGETPALPAELQGAEGGGALDREHPGGEVQRLVDRATVPVAWDELDACGGGGVGRFGSGTPQRGVGRLAP